MKAELNYQPLALFFSDEEVNPLQVSNAIRGLIIERSAELAQNLCVATEMEGEEWKMLNDFCECITKLTAKE